MTGTVWHTSPIADNLSTQISFGGSGNGFLNSLNPIEKNTARGAILYDGQVLDQVDEAWFDPSYWQAEGRVLGQAAGRGTTLIVEGITGAWVLRHFQRGGLAAKPFKDRYFWKRSSDSRPFREWHLLAELVRRGLPVPTPVAARVERSGMWYRGDLITAYIPDTQSLAERLDLGHQDEGVWAAIGRQLRRFHDEGVDHADLNAHNILLDGDLNVFVVDLDRGEIRATGQWARKNLDRLERSLRKLATQRGGAFPAVGWRALRLAYDNER